MTVIAVREHRIIAHGERHNSRGATLLFRPLSDLDVHFGIMPHAHRHNRGRQQVLDTDDEHSDNDGSPRQLKNPPMINPDASRGQIVKVRCGAHYDVTLRPNSP